MDRGKFVEMPPQGLAYMTALQRLDIKVRLAVLEALEAGAGTWNVGTLLGHVAKDAEQMGDRRVFDRESRDDILRSVHLLDTVEHPPI